MPIGWIRPDDDRQQADEPDRDADPGQPAHQVGIQPLPFPRSSVAHRALAIVEPLEDRDWREQ